MTAADVRLVQAVAAESPRFAAPLLFVHGLWCTPAVWRRYQGYAAHRGWDSIALELPGRARPAAGGATDWADWERALGGAIAAMDAPPVVIGHDLGALLALGPAARAARAVVAVAPVVPADRGGAGVPAARGLRVRYAAWRGRLLPPPRGARAHAFGGVPPGGFVADSARVARAARAWPWPHTAPAAPALVIAADDDRWAPAAAVAGLAGTLGLPARTLPGSHALPWSDGWQQLVAEVHRWLVQTLGEPLLLLREEEDDAGGSTP